MDRRLSFGENLRIATNNAIQCGANLARLMPNIGGPREAKRLVANVVHSKLLYTAPVWVSALDNHDIQKRLSSKQRGAAMRIISTYRTVSTNAVLVLANVPPIDSLAYKRATESAREGRLLPRQQQIAFLESATSAEELLYNFY